ncbi:hypothetical protein LZC95_16670 [Pendulispora brunnea]|uniref:Uncharacterized protein n=1 Tax=Pendulispora brunnea TaxID=2905690 RepID=A0ABZ2KIS1_9BACT
MTTPRKPPIMDDDPDALPTEEELRAAEALRAALDDPALAHDDAAFARSLALAHAPRELAPDEHRAILEQALAPAPAVPAATKRRGGIVVRVAFGAAATAISMAAAFALLVRAPQEPLGLTRPHSTQSLFHEPFSTQGGTSARIDRIATARASDLRDNQFARWGVR